MALYDLEERIRNTPPEERAKHLDPLIVYNDMYEVMGAHATAYISAIRGQSYYDVYEVPRDELMHYYSQMELSGLLLTYNGVKFFNMMALEPALQMFEDAVKYSPKAYAEPSFYQIVMSMTVGVLGLDVEWHLDRIFSIDPDFSSKVDTLISYCSARDLPEVVVKIKKLFPPKA